MRAGNSTFQRRSHLEVHRGSALIEPAIHTQELAPVTIEQRHITPLSYLHAKG